MNVKTVRQVAVAGIAASLLFVGTAGSAFAHFCYNADKPDGAGNHSSVVITLTWDGTDYVESDFQVTSNHPGQGNGGPERMTGGWADATIVFEGGGPQDGQFVLDDTNAHVYLQQAGSNGSPDHGIQDYSTP